MGYLTGFHAIEEMIKSGKACGPLLVAKAGPRARALVTLAQERKIQINRAGEHELNRISRDHRGIALMVDGQNLQNEVSLDEFLSDQEEGTSAIVVILDSITDPHNYGAILRSCDQFGVNLVIHSARRSAKDTETVSKTSAGASAWVPTATVPNLVRAVQDLKKAGYWIYGADMKGSAVHSLDLKGKVALIMGSEGNGIARLLEEQCDNLVSIPSRGKVDSLNVSVATGVLLYEISRQQH